jgi:putative SOS response-associated peptidase YedK
MCGRYSRRWDKQRIAEAFQAGNVDGMIYEDTDENAEENEGVESGSSEGAASYNVAPQTMQPVVRLHPDAGRHEVAMLRWGMIPFWAKDAKIAYSTINARSETVTTSPIFREAIKRRRCLVPADAFYEWQKIDAKRRQPYAIALNDQKMFAFAGLWETWIDKANDRQLDTYTILTTDPNELMEPFHDRMPVILDPKDYERWLAPSDSRDSSHLPIDLLRPYPAKKMRSWKVSNRVGNVRNNDENLLAPLVETPKAAMQGSLFE